MGKRSISGVQYIESLNDEQFLKGDRNGQHTETFRVLQRTRDWECWNVGSVKGSKSGNSCRLAEPLNEEQFVNGAKKLTTDRDILLSRIDW